MSGSVPAESWTGGAESVRESGYFGGFRDKPAVKDPVVSFNHPINGTVKEAAGDCLTEFTITLTQRNSGGSALKKLGK